MKVWINNKFADMKDARISIFDRGFLYGDGVFETMRCYAGKIFRLDDHIGRLFNALKVMSMKPPYSKEYLKAVIYKILRINRLNNAYIRLSITRGEGRFGIGYKDQFNPNTVIVAKGFEEYPEWMHGRGISAKTARIRQNEYSPLSGIKSMNFLNYILARLEAKKEGFDEAILMNTKGRIAEAATSNIFIVKGEALATPSLDSGILPGVTRAVVIEIAGKLRLKVKEEGVTYKELLNADEVFLTNSLAEVLPVISVDGKDIGTGNVGEVTKLLRIAYQKEVIRETLS